jgi:hypothetical protein
MSSNIDYDYFDYNSSQDYFDIEDQIDLFEFRHSIKNGKRSKLKLKHSPCPISAENLRSQPKLLKIDCQPDRQIPEAKPKPFHCEHLLPVSSNRFECHRKSNKESKPSKKLTEKHLTNFNEFREYFYSINRKHIKSSLADNSHVKIVNIRAASVDESVQQQFMKRLNKNPKHLPHLVFPASRPSHVELILRFGFVVPKNRVYPTNKQAPIIESIRGQFGRGIYCSQRATYSAMYTRSTNSLPVCAAIGNARNGKMKYHDGNIIVLSHVSLIVPLFLLDFTFSSGPDFNYP